MEGGSMTNSNDSALNYILELTDQQFWGFLTLKFEAGKVVHVRREENLKPSELPGKNRGRGHARDNR
jgi:hypothetical protein